MTNPTTGAGATVSGAGEMPPVMDAQASFGFDAGRAIILPPQQDG